MRTLIDLPVDDLERLDALARRNKRSRAAEVRDAVRLYLRGREGNDWIERGFGYWRDRTDIGDGVEYQQRIREDRSEV